MSKAEEYSELVKQRQSCRLCEGLVNQSVVQGGELETGLIDSWALWQGGLDAPVMVIGQDWTLQSFIELRGHPTTGDHISWTNRNLIHLLFSIGINIRPYERGEQGQEVFLTNAVLCLKDGKRSSSIKQGHANRCMGAIGRKLIEIIRPKAVVTLSVPTYRATAKAFCIQPLSGLRAAVDVEDGFLLFDDTRLFPMFHCSPLGVANSKGLENQVLDWAKVGRHINGE